MTSASTSGPHRSGSVTSSATWYEYLIGNFASDAGKKGGEFYTPAEVSRLLATIARSETG